MCIRDSSRIVCSLFEFVCARNYELSRETLTIPLVGLNFSYKIISLYNTCSFSGNITLFFKVYTYKLEGKRMHKITFSVWEYGFLKQ